MPSRNARSIRPDDPGEHGASGRGTGASLLAVSAPLDRCSCFVQDAHEATTVAQPELAPTTTIGANSDQHPLGTAFRPHAWSANRLDALRVPDDMPTAHAHLA